MPTTVHPLLFPPTEQFTHPHLREAPSSSLDLVETSVTLPQRPPPSAVSELPRTPELTYRHRHWWRHRTAVYHALYQANVPNNRLQRFRACGSAAWVLENPNPPHNLKIAANYCHDRFCLPCQTQRARVIAKSVAGHARDRQLRFLTLTIRHSKTPLSEQLTKLVRDFRALRRTKLWRASVLGGVAFIEVKRARDRQHWHPHVHVIIEGRYMPVSAIAHEWHRITGNSYIVDIRTVDNANAAAKYVTTYAAKPLSYATTNDPAALTEAVSALAARNLYFSFGSWRRVKLRPKPTLQEWSPVLPLAELLRRAAAGQPEALTILKRLNEDQSCPQNPPHAEPKQSPPPIHSP